MNPGFCEESFSKLCAWAVYHNFLSSNNIGTSGQEARRLSHTIPHSLAECPDINFAGLGEYVENLCVYKRRKERDELAQLFIFIFFPFFSLERSPPFFSSLLLSRILIGGSYFFRSGFFSFLVFGDISVVFYWFVHHMEGDNGQDIGHTRILDFSLLSFGCACPLCVLVEGETLLHRACKRNQVETVLQILALPGTDINVKGKTFSLSLFSLTAESPPSLFTPTVCSGVLKSDQH